MKPGTPKKVQANGKSERSMEKQLTVAKQSVPEFLASVFADCIGTRPEGALDALNAVLHTAAEFLDLEYAALLIWLPENSQLRIRSQFSRSTNLLPDFIPYDWPLLADGIHVADSCNRLKLKSLTTKAAIPYEPLKSRGLDDVIVVPVVKNEKFLGGLLFATTQSSLPSETEEVACRLAKPCFDLNSLALHENPRLHELQMLVGGDTEMVFNNVIDSLNEGVSCCDNDGCVLYSNPSMERITGYPLDEVKGKRIYEFWFSTQSPVLPDRVSAQHRRYEDRRSGMSEEYETQISRKDGQLRWLNIKASPLRNKEGKIVGSIGVIADITERKALEAQLLWSQKLEAVGRLAGSVAHDFNNLLTVISGYANMILKRLPEKDVNLRATESILAASAAASSLTQQLLTVSRRQVVQPQLVDLNQSVRHTTGIIRGLIGSEIELNADLADDLAPIYVDPGQLQQVIMNLAINARDAMPTGGTLKILTHAMTCIQPDAENSQMEPGDYIVLSVNDTGSGMDEFIRARLFEPFFTTKREGNGLGLSTVYGIVKQHGAHISVVSEQGLGSTFTIYFPASDAVLDIPDIVEITEKPRLTGNSEAILVVEDEDSVRELICSVLRESGYKVLEASNGLEGMDILEAQCAAIDLLLTDISMPQMNGIELTDRALKMRPDLKVLTMSGCTHDSTIPENIRKRQIPFLAKPFIPDTLLQKLKECLESGPSAIETP